MTIADFDPTGIILIDDDDGTARWVAESAEDEATKLIECLDESGIEWTPLTIASGVVRLLLQSFEKCSDPMPGSTVETLLAVCRRSAVFAAELTIAGRSCGDGASVRPFQSAS